MDNTIWSEMYIQSAIDIERLKINNRLHVVSCHKIIVAGKGAKVVIIIVGNV